MVVVVVRPRRFAPALGRIAVVIIDRWVFDELRTLDGPAEPHSARADLGRILREEGPFNPDRAIRVVRGIAAALDEWHDSGRVHGDVRPDTVLIDPRSDEVRLTGGAADIVVPDYAAPERHRGQAADRRTDVYSLGCVAYECLTNATPFPRTTDDAVVNAHLYDPVPKVSGKGVARAVDAVIARALAKRPEDRYQTCAELARDLAAALARPRPWRLEFWRRHKATAALATVVIVTAAVVTPFLLHDGADLTGDAFPTADEKALIDLVDLSGCRRATPGDPRHVVAAIECTPPGSGARTVFYYRFTTPDLLRQAFDGLAQEAGAPTGVYCAGDEPPPGFLGNKRYDQRSVDIGGLLCHPGPGSTLVMQWSVEQLRLLGRAIGTDPDDLSGWWDDYSGPSNAKIAEAVNAAAVPPFPSRAERRLLDLLPPGSHWDCTRVPASQRRTNAPDAVAGVVCGGRGANIVFYYQFPDNTSMVANYRASGEPRGPDCTTVPKDFRGEGAYSRDGTSGRLFCATNDGGGRFLTWTNDQLNIQAFAFAVAEPDVLFDWWLHESGPRLTPSREASG